jgi:hypothetical protein
MSDAGTDGTANDAPFVLDTGSGCEPQENAPVSYELCVDGGDAEADACASGCFQACERMYKAVGSCVDDGIDAGIVSATCMWCVGGRRPVGLRTPRAGNASLRGWLRRAAWMEAASVHAFARLVRELDAHGAPRWLVAEARRAVVDESRHARSVGRVARAHHVRVPRPVFSKQARARSLVAIARENAVEGCVHETYAALVAVVQSERATNATVRDAMARIAPDEKRHAALAHAIAHWITPRLTRTERERVDASRRAAADKLATSLASQPSIPAAGLPGGAEARALARALFVALTLAAPRKWSVR